MHLVAPPRGRRLSLSFVQSTGAALYVSRFASSAHAMRAVLLASLPNIQVQRLRKRNALPDCGFVPDPTPVMQMPGPYSQRATITSLSSHRRRAMLPSSLKDTGIGFLLS